MPLSGRGTGAAVIGKNLYVAAGWLKLGRGDQPVDHVHHARRRGRLLLLKQPADRINEIELNRYAEFRLSIC
jgi:hypothetical protein